ncbi:hypothetical protein V8C86DRAFT_3026801 [Haematococcus lacustris]
MVGDGGCQGLGLLVRVCRHDPDRGVELVGAIQRCLIWLWPCSQDAVLDPSPDVAALGLGALAPLCHADVLDFYKAWRVHPLLSSESFGPLPNLSFATDQDF